MDGWAEEWVDVGMGGWVGLKVGFININDMYNNDVGKGRAQGCEAYEQGCEAYEVQGCEAYEVK
jgi:hypothetical protein